MRQERLTAFLFWLPGFVGLHFVTGLVQLRHDVKAIQDVPRVLNVTFDYFRDSKQ